MDPVQRREPCRLMSNTRVKRGGSTNLSALGFSGVARDVMGLGRTEGKQQVDHLANGQEMRWRPSRRTLTEPGADHLSRIECVKQVQPKDGHRPWRCERLHIRQRESKEEHSDCPSGLRIVVDENGVPSSRRPAHEFELESVMTRKRQILSLEQQRNNLGCNSMGDKQYRHPEYDTGFFHAGALVPGCSFTRGSHAKTVPRNTTAWKAFLAENPDAVKAKTYQQLVEEATVADAVHSVTGLLEWERGVLLECDEQYGVFDDYEDSEDEEVKQRLAPPAQEEEKPSRGGKKPGKK